MAGWYHPAQGPRPPSAASRRIRGRPE